MSTTFEINHAETDDELTAEVDGDLDDKLDEDVELEALREQIKALRAQVTKLGGIANAVSTASSVRTTLTSDPPEVPDSDTEDEEPSDDLDEKKDALKQASKDTADTTPEELKWTVSKYLVLAMAIGGSGLGVYELLHYLFERAAHPDRPKPELPQLDPDTKKTLDTLYDKWRSKPDEDFWNSLADDMTKNTDKLSLGDQLVFMNITIAVGGPSGGFLWATAQDEANLVNTLVGVYQDAADGGSAPMIRKAATLEYDGKAMPRVITADLLRLAFAWVGVQASGKVDE